ncbi:hypothetical protein WN944_014791 [Citrus x changshan-huyou]|uniref:AIG1-type G domain-containing protein n=1 Tax=Citrus x changshan-huyou TaxID=2935761 RepID=A0AAP0M6E2_9ROSI
MAKDGIHAGLLDFFVTSHFSREEEVTVHRLQTLFGKIVFYYMIVVFTGGDDLENNEKTLEDYLGLECPKPLKVNYVDATENMIMSFRSFEVWSLEFVYDNSTVFCLVKRQEILQLCDNRCVLLDNKTKYEVKNGGQPYTNEFFAELKVTSLLS